jgi:hypothetical protein
MSDHNPIIFILDLDGTIIGDCTYQCDIYNIECALKKNSIKKSSNLLLKCYKKKSKLIRPYFLYFMNKMKIKFPNSLFYIYTASEKIWAHKEIQLIEKTHEIKFNRPLFTREDCILGSDNTYKKSVKKILPKISKSIKNKNISSESIFVVDNNKTFIDYTDNLLICPTYDYVLFDNLWNNIPRESLKIKEVKSIIKRLISQNKICHVCHHYDNNMKQLEIIYEWLYLKHKYINDENAKYNKDKFWKLLANMIIKYNINFFNKHNVRFLQKKIQLKNISVK